MFQRQTLCRDVYIFCGHAGEVRKRFYISAGVILVITGTAKIWSGLGSGAVLRMSDPLFNLQFGHLMLVAGVVELVIASACFFSKYEKLAVICLAWLSTCLLIYRLGLWWLGWHRPCSCLGNLTDALHISPQIADTAMKIVLAYLLIGSYGILAQKWWRRSGLAVERSEVGSEKCESEVGG
jgi:hypothetical protein